MRGQAPRGAGKALVEAYVAADRLLGALEPGSGPCRLWPYGKSDQGYGKVAGFHTMYVHRLTLEAHVGPAYVGVCEISGKLEWKKHAAHSCRNRHCNSVQHLSWKTVAENQADRLRDGTDNQGEKHGASKLTEADVLEIRKRYATGRITQRALAEEYGVTQSVISEIVNRKIWTHLPNYEMRKTW